ncbi:hypothetical protein K435DRAFT_217371 [Dendrothele bispora CBS 962.96]|uniref:Zn(2)-C6 fungal-type domain-containing protein n=1 Tax=Dendrothele bispora (strain CBS 962.96) TaxID=1314807 RepID=A0A4S8LS60_DENBC|nr:hypothetical protein K435DRAFT_217371 [Dendrothele bispora CBS 962.96]
MSDAIEEIINTTVTGKPLPISRRCDACAARHTRCFKPNPGIVCHWCFENGVDCTYKRLKPKRGRKRYRKGLNVFQISTTDKSSDGQTNNEVTPTPPTPPPEYPVSPLSSTAPLEIVPAEEENACHSQIVQYPPALSSSPNSAASESSASLELPTYEYNISSTGLQNFPPDAVLVHEDSQIHYLSVHVLNMRLATQFAEPYAMESQDLNGQYVYNHEVVPTTPQTVQEDAVDTDFLFCPIPRKPFVKELRALIDQHCASSPQEQSIRTSLTPSLLQRPCVDVFRRSRSTFEPYDPDYTSTSGSFITNSKAEGPYSEAGPPPQTHENDTPATAYYYTLSESVPVDFVTDRYLDYCNHIFATPNLNF